MDRPTDAQTAAEVSTPAAKRNRVKGTPTMVTSKARGGWSSKDSGKKGKKNGRRVATGSASLTNWLGTARTSTPEVKSLGSKVISKGGTMP